MSSNEDPKFKMDPRPPRLVLVKPAPNRAPRFIALSAMLHAGGIAAVLYLSLPVFETTKTETISVEIGGNNGPPAEGSAPATEGAAPTKNDDPSAPAQTSLPAPIAPAQAAPQAKAAPAPSEKPVTPPPPPTVPDDLVTPEDFAAPAKKAAPDTEEEPPIAKALPVKTLKPEPKKPAPVPKPEPKPVEMVKSEPVEQPKLLTQDESPVETADEPKEAPVEAKDDPAPPEATEPAEVKQAEEPEKADDKPAVAAVPDHEAKNDIEETETNARVVPEVDQQAIADAKAAEKARLAAVAAAEKQAEEQAAREEAERAASLAAASAAAAKSAGEGKGTGQEGPGSQDTGEQIAGSPSAGTPGGVRSLDQLRQRPGNPKPSYNESERLANQRGEVTYQAYVDESGTPTEFRQISTTGYPNLDQKTLEALKQWKFYPGQAGWVEIPIRWDLKGGYQERSALGRRKVGALVTQ